MYMCVYEERAQDIISLRYHQKSTKNVSALIFYIISNMNNKLTPYDYEILEQFHKSSEPSPQNLV